MYRHLDAEARKQMAWFVTARLAWEAHTQRHSQLPDKHGNSNGQRYPATYNLIRFRPANRYGNYECTLLVRRKVDTKYVPIPIAWKFFKTSRTEIAKLLRSKPELKAIILALDEACVPIRYMDRLVRKLRHEHLMLRRMCVRLQRQSSAHEAGGR